MSNKLEYPVHLYLNNINTYGFIKFMELHGQKEALSRYATRIAILVALGGFGIVAIEEGRATQQEMHANMYDSDVLSECQNSTETER